MPKRVKIKTDFGSINVLPITAAELNLSPKTTITSFDTFMEICDKDTENITCIAEILEAYRNNLN